MLNRAPRWLRPPLFGAATMFLVVVIPGALFMLLEPQARSPENLRDARIGLLVAVAAGAAAGLAFSLLGRRLIGIPYAGRTIAGTLSVMAYLVPVFSLDGFGSLAESELWAVTTGIAVVMGAVLGLFLPDEAGQPAAVATARAPLVFALGLTAGVGAAIASSMVPGISPWSGVGIALALAAAAYAWALYFRSRRRVPEPAP